MFQKRSTGDCLSSAPQFARCLCLAFAFSLNCHSQAAIVLQLQVDMTGWQADSFALGDTGNTTQVLDVSPNAKILSVEYAINFDSFAPSVLGEFVLSIENSSPTLATGFWNHRPAGINFQSGNFAGSGMFTTMDPSLEFPSGGPFSLLNDGQLRVGVWELFPDAGASPDARINSGQLTVNYEVVPEPSALAGGVLACGWVILRRRSGRPFKRNTVSSLQAGCLRHR